ncbi:MAG TPA: NusG domain II-containing protein [Candidatus Enterocloster faecavium]|uniref:NusG domain II-containing protein n=1 Tax=Candidatus Enterocloster faecavium TaxID=2838560 RepID=A0A9D2L6K9_9FIRM|nr:NusG domain II-containing protein [Candidatus Enterocloster faecavium]
MAKPNIHQPTQKEKGGIRRNDFLLLLLILVLAGVWLVFSHFRSAPGLIAQVAVDGQVIETLPLDQDGEFDIPGIDGGNNHLIVKDGQIWCSQATCPDHLCMKQGKKSMANETIVCLPNRMSVTVLEGR